MIEGCVCSISSLVFCADGHRVEMGRDKGRGSATRALLIHSLTDLLRFASTRPQPLRSLGGCTPRPHLSRAEDVEEITKKLVESSDDRQADAPFAQGHPQVRRRGNARQHQTSEMLQ